MEALYSKYRPKVFSDVVGQKTILQTLQNAIVSNKISHAYMFCGPRGTGKTTMARLLAKACMCMEASDNNNPSISFCGKCVDCEDIASGNHPDVYELDAASRTGVENVREEIINRVGFAAVRGQKKIYIIDEVHMLSTAAFNALLKTLEEPPSHVIFILCTTDPQKVPDTILSRCQRFDFNSISPDDIFERLKFVCKSEKVDAEDDALFFIAQKANGAMRNALTNLEQSIAFTEGELTLENLSMTGDIEIVYSVLIENLGMRDLPGAFDWVSQVCAVGVDFNQITSKLIQIFRDMYVKSSGGDENLQLDEDVENTLGLYTSDRLHRILIILSELELDMKTSNNLRLSFELAMAKIANPKSELTLESLAERISNLEVVVNSGEFSLPVEENTEEEVTGKHTENSNDENDEANVEEDIDKDVVEEEKDTEIPRKVVKVVKNQSPEQTLPDLKIPEHTSGTNFSQERENLKQEANLKMPELSTNEKLNRSEELQKLWHKAFSRIRNKYPGFGATLLTATPSFDNLSNQFILSFPGSASFNVGVLKKADSIEKIHTEIKEVMGQDIGFNIVIESSQEDGFNPKFSNNFRENSNSAEDEDLFPPDNTNPTFDRSKANTIPLDEPESTFAEDFESPFAEEINQDPLKDMLNNMGAYNITEE